MTKYQIALSLYDKPICTIIQCKNDFADMSVYNSIYQDVNQDLIPIVEKIHVTCKLYSMRTMLPFILLFIYQYLPTISSNNDFTSIY